ncbi:phage tail protein I [Scandinavium manionii]|uniref:phage tail protein I n=1 Tax=Scandinavium manionii TaxID=2926520 RepID=UPI0021654F9A|nr:phage tail protein I [Scandinavium manionii]MCS2168142.1 phage tail protein I [Scandinavium manionii]
MNNNMLPSSASGFMHSTEKVTERLTDIPVDLRKLWNPDECPADLLPYLAWALSVDRWDKNWSEQTKRQVIKASWLVHRQKGTISALRRAVEPFNFHIQVIEWWQSGGEPGTFRLEIGIQEQGITEETYLELERLVDDAKPRSRHLTGLSISLQSLGYIEAGAGCYIGDTLTVYPYLPGTISVGGVDCIGAAVHLIDTVEIASGD